MISAGNRTGGTTAFCAARNGGMKGGSVPERRNAVRAPDMRKERRFCQAPCRKRLLKMAAPVAFRHTCKGKAEKSILMNVHTGNIKRAAGKSKGRRILPDFGRKRGETLMLCALRAGHLAGITVTLFRFPMDGELFSYIPYIMHVC